MEADKVESARVVGRCSIGGDTDVTSLTIHNERWGDRLAASEYLPSFSHALSLGEMDNIELMGSGRRRKAQKGAPRRRLTMASTVVISMTS
ncbi:unnamed protein product [Miscanthus lutarioriparius]|uniref:Uncharacterized protein n=1 Tax=Miscanthus lutarioriparius TaxID=422564 RepID=A0A811QNF0_9POAL|nr:unnamed protein product [Miscanthus lutarioriparius]